MSWANAAFIAVLLLALVGWVMFDRVHRQQRAQRKRERLERKAGDRADRLIAAAGRERRQADLDAIHRHYRTMVRFYHAGYDPAELSPVWLPSKGPHPGVSHETREPESSSSQRPSW